MTFEWDERKNEINKRLHGISFERARQVFSDPNALIIPDPYEEEERWNAIGFIGRMIFVVYTERNGGVVRLISARKATKEEEHGYRARDYRRHF